MTPTARQRATNGRHGVAPGLARAGATAWHLIGVGLAVLLAGWAAGRLMPVLLPVGVAVLLSTLLRPVAAGLERRSVPPTPAAVAALGLAVGVVGAVAWLVVPPFAARVSDLVSSVDKGAQRLAYSIGNDLAGVDRAAVDRMLDDALSGIRNHAGGLAGDAFTGATALAGGLAAAVLVVFLSFFLVRDGQRIWLWMVELAPERRRRSLEEMGARAWAALGVYAKGVVFVATVDAVFIGMALLIVGVPLALPLIVLTWVAAFFPIVGALVAGTAAVLVALVANGLTSALVVLAAIVAVQQIEGNVLYPVVVGPRLKLHPIVVLTAVAAGGTIAGIAGAFLAVPVATVCAALLGYVREERSRDEAATEPAAQRGVVLGNRQS